MKLKLVHLYPKEMNIYGDTGNIIVLKKRMEWRGIECELIRIGKDQELPLDADIIVGGGGQDSGQSEIEVDLGRKKQPFIELADNSVVMLMICGMYQLFGDSFTTIDGVEITGLGILPISTKASEKRMVGNVLVRSKWGELVGYENHSGKTILKPDAKPLGNTIRGDGNNGNDGTEGCVYKNIFGSYMHGPLLSKNPKLADELIDRAVIRKYPGESITQLDDSMEWSAHKIASHRPR